MAVLNLKLKFKKVYIPEILRKMGSTVIVIQTKKKSHYLKKQKTTFVHG